VLDVIDADTVLVRAAEARATEVLRAEVAAIGYAPVVGDRVVVQPGDDAFFVTGALGDARRRAAGGMVATVSEHGGVVLRVPAGDLTLSAAGRIVLRAGEVETVAEIVHTTASEVVTRAGRLEVEATRIVERAGDRYQKVEGLDEIQAGRARTLVEGSHDLAARRVTVASDEDTVIDGRRVLLG
jgi:hypothetical protein